MCFISKRMLVFLSLLVCLLLFMVVNMLDIAAWLSQYRVICDEGGVIVRTERIAMSSALVEDGYLDVLA